MALKASPEDQALLLDLQALDTRLAQLDHRARSLPELATLAELAARAEEFRRVLAEQTGAVEDTQLELSRVESDVKVVEDRIARDSERLQASSSVKDVAALEQELAALRKRLTASAGRRTIEGKVPADLLALYEKQRARYGTGASLLQHGVSKASGVKLLEDELQKIRAAAPDDVLICPSSDAILVRTSESGL